MRMTLEGSGVRSMIVAFFVVGASIVGCSPETVEAAAEVTAIRPLPDGGSELEISVKNHLDDSADARCTVEAPGAGNSFVVEIDGIRPSETRPLTTNLPGLSPDTRRNEIDLSCHVES